jgi:hypothetical protein
MPELRAADKLLLLPPDALDDAPALNNAPAEGAIWTLAVMECLGADGVPKESGIG